MRFPFAVLLIACKREAAPPPTPPAPEVVPKPVVDASVPIDAPDVVVVDAVAKKPGGVKGRILFRDTTPANSQAGPHPGCTVTAIETATKKVLVGKTDKQGDYRIELPPGKYAVNFADCGVVDCSSTRGSTLGVVIEDGNWPTLSLTMQSCNKCLDARTQIATPDGDVAIARLRVGDRVIVDRGGKRVVTTIAAVQRVAARHALRRVRLADGRVVGGAPLHPFADGRGIGAVELGDRVDGSAVVEIVDLPYSDGHAYDILPLLDGAYIAGGLPLRSTMR